MQNSDQKIMNLQQRRRQNNNSSLPVHLFLSPLEKIQFHRSKKIKLSNFRFISGIVVAAQLERISLNAYFPSSK